MKKIFLSFILGTSLTHAYSQELTTLSVKRDAPMKDTAITVTKKDTVVAKREPFAFGDFTWLNGNDRRHKALIKL